MAPEKSKWILFSKCPRHKKSDVVLIMNDQIIPNCNQITFLGILFDEKLSWKPYLDKIIQHATSKAIQIQSISAKNRFASPSQSIAFFNSIRIWGKCIPYNLIKSMESNRQIPRQILRGICGLPRCYSYSKLCDQLQQEKLSIQIKDQAAKRAFGICKTSPYAPAWIAERGFKWEGDSLIRISTHAQYDTYRSPVEFALDRHLQLENLT